MRVGDVIIGFRDMVPDVQGLGTLAAPSTEMSAPAQAASVGSTLPAATYQCALAYENEWGSTTLGSTTAGIVIGADQGIRIAGTPRPGAVYAVAYFGVGAFTQCTRIAVASLPYTINAAGTAANSPTRNTAYHPDSDGLSISAGTVYRWLNEALELAAELCGGGIPDQSGVASTAGQPLYNLTGNWHKLDGAWYDGYPIYTGRKTDVFRRNAVQGFVAGLSWYSISDRFIIEVWPQPSRTAGSTTLGADLAVSATTATLAASNFTLGFGLAMIGNEIVNYASNSAGSMTGIVRGLAGTTATAWPAGTTVRELNLAVSGLRIPSPYSVGEATRTISTRPGVSTALQLLMLHKFRLTEQRAREAMTVYAEAQSLLQTVLRSNKQFAGPVQVQVGGRGYEVYPGLGSSGGGLIVP